MSWSIVFVLYVNKVHWIKKFVKITFFFRNSSRLPISVYDDKDAFF